MKNKNFSENYDHDEAFDQYVQWIMTDTEHTNEEAVNIAHEYFAKQYAKLGYPDNMSQRYEEIVTESSYFRYKQ